ncbi:hypothetical protein VPH35_038233 [Triticum aestivum]
MTMQVWTLCDRIRLAWQMDHGSCLCWTPFDAFILTYYLQMDYALKFPFYTTLERLDRKWNIIHSDARGSHILKTQYLPYGINQELFALADEDFTFSQSIH